MPEATELWAYLNGALVCGAVGPMTRRLMAAWAELTECDFVTQALNHLPPEERVSLEQQWQATQP